MKLVEILAREMEEWPEGAVVAMQDFDGQVVTSTGRCVEFSLNQWDSDGRGSVTTRRDYATKAEDRDTAIVTREMWQAERDRLHINEAADQERKKATPRANKDGWIRHRGGKCPEAAVGILIDIKRRDDRLMEGIASTGYWKHEGDDLDVMQWRPHVAEREMIMEGVKDAREGNLIPGDQLREEWAERSLSLHSQWCCRAYRDNPLQWRDRIHTIDAEQRQADQAHKASTEARAHERAELVSKLAGEGLALLGKEEDKQGEDMSDWKNWKDGDLVECIQCPGKHSGYFTTGRTYELFCIDPGDEGTACEIDVYSNKGISLWCPSNCFKWHSRP